MTEVQTQAPRKSRYEVLVEKYEALSAKITELVTKRDELVLQINDIVRLQSVDVGHTVIISVKSGEEKVDVNAVVVGIKEDDTGSKLYKVSYGSGFDANVAILKAKDLRLPPAVEAEGTAVSGEVVEAGPEAA